MCRCTPIIKTPFCGKPGCEWPPQPPEDPTEAALRDSLAYIASRAHAAMARLRSGDRGFVQVALQDLKSKIMDASAGAAGGAGRGEWRYFNDDRVRLSDGAFGIVTGRGADGLLRIRPEAKPDWNTGDLTRASDDDLDAWRGTPDSLEFGYTNWRGEFGMRRAQPIRLYYGSTEWHPEPQWLLEAMDLGKGERRTFAVKDMQPTQAAAMDMRGLVKRLIAYSQSQDCDSFVWKMKHPDPDGGVGLWEVEVRPAAARSARS